MGSFNSSNEKVKNINPKITCPIWTTRWTWMELVYYCFNNKKMFLEINEPFKKIYPSEYIGLRMSFDNSQFENVNSLSFSPLLQTSFSKYNNTPIWFKYLLRNKNCKQFVYIIYDDLIVPIPLEIKNSNEYNNDLNQLSYFINKSHHEAKRIYGSLSNSMELLPTQSGSSIIRKL